MKIRILDRVLVALAGLLLIALGGAVFAQLFFAVPMSDYFASIFTLKDTQSIVIISAAAGVVVLLGLYCLCMLFRHKKGKRGFVVQKTDGGELSISVKAIENLVQKCIDKHDELHVLSTNLVNTRDGLTIKLRIGLASGVSIPLVVGALQKQIKTYITACSGVDVHEVKVQVETASAKLKDSPYAVPEMMATLPNHVEEIPQTEPASPVAARADVTPAPVPVPTREETETAAADERPIHQRIFGREEAPVLMPELPTQEPETAPEQDTETAADAAADAADVNEETMPTEEEEDTHEIAQ